MTEITDEQRAAVEWLRKQRIFTPHAKPLLAALPDALTNPQPALPTEPGAYHDARGTLMIIDLRGNWRGTYGDIINPELCPAPFTRLVPERPQVTREQVSRAIADVAQQFGLPVHTASYVSALTKALEDGTSA